MIFKPRNNIKTAGKEGAKDSIRYWLDKSYEDSCPYLSPVRLDISITTDCNTKCAYCWQQQKNGSLLTFDNVAGVIDDICALNPPKLNLTGGEPTIWPDFEKLIDYAKNKGIRKVLLCTNGIRLADLKFADKIINLGVTGINISVDTLNPEKFKFLRGYDFKILNRILSNCVILKKKYPGVFITLCSVMSKEVTPEELFAVKEFSDKNNLGYFMQTFDHTRYFDINKKFNLSSAERQEYHQRIDWLQGMVGEAVKRNNNPLIDTDKVKCYKGITTVKLTSDGSVSFCWKSKPIGNILKDKFIDIWISQKAKEMRKYIRDKQCDCIFDCDVFESLELYEGS